MGALYRGWYTTGTGGGGPRVEKVAAARLTNGARPRQPVRRGAAAPRAAKRSRGSMLAAERDVRATPLGCCRVAMLVAADHALRCAGQHSAERGAARQRPGARRWASTLRNDAPAWLGAARDGCLGACSCWAGACCSAAFTQVSAQRPGVGHRLSFLWFEVDPRNAPVH